MKDYLEGKENNINMNMTGENHMPHMNGKDKSNIAFRPRFETIATCGYPSLPLSPGQMTMSTSLQPIPEAQPMITNKKCSIPTLKFDRLSPPKDLCKPISRHGSLVLDEFANKSNGNLSQSQDISNGSVKMGRKHSLRQSFRSGFKPLKARFSSKRVRNRLVQKNGICNISLANVPSQRQKFFNDIFTTLVDSKWRWVLLTFMSGFILSWIGFSLVFYTISFVHGDLNDQDANSTFVPCIANVNSYISVFLFTFETQTTIGYGFRYPTDLCPPVIVVVCAQNMLGVMLQTMIAGVVFAKLARPKKRAETLIFSEKGVICMRDSKLCFLFRVGDMRRSQLAEAHIRMQLIKKRITAEGELLPFHQFDMNVGFDTGLDRIFVMWPITICHVIDEDSPMYDLSQEALQSDARFEILVILEGVVESTGATTQARTSYIPNEIFWGHRFEKLITFQRDNGSYRIDFSRFHSTYAVATPTFSQKELDDMMEQGLHPTDAYKWDHLEQVENMGVTPYATVQHPRSPLRPHIRTLFEVKQLSTVCEKVILPVDDRPPSPLSVESFNGTELEEMCKEDIETGSSNVIVNAILSAPIVLPGSSSRGNSPVDGVKLPKKYSVLREHDIM